MPAALDLCRAQAIDLVVPTIDHELAAWAQHRDAFAEVGTTVLVSSPAVVEIGGDKVASNRWLLAHGFPVAAQASVDAVLADVGAWPFPLVVKPRSGSGGMGFALVRDADELRVLGAGRDVVVETFAPGTEYTIDVLVGRDGATRCACARRRMEVRGGEVVKAVVERRPELEDLATELCDRLPGAYGVLNVQVMRDPVAGLHVIELNPRFGGGFPLTHAAGGRYATWVLEEVLGLPSTLDAGALRDGLVMLRYDDAVFLDGATIEAGVRAGA